MKRGSGDAPLCLSCHPERSDRATVLTSGAISGNSLLVKTLKRTSARCSTSNGNIEAQQEDPGNSGRSSSTPSRARAARACSLGARRRCSRARNIFCNGDGPPSGSEALMRDRELGVMPNSTRNLRIWSMARSAMRRYGFTRGRPFGVLITAPKRWMLFSASTHRPQA